MVKNKQANWFGISSVVINAVFWLLVLNPFGWGGFPNDTVISEAAILLALIGSLVAVWKASRWWFISTVASLVAFVAIQYALR